MRTRLLAPINSLLDLRHPRKASPLVLIPALVFVWVVSCFLPPNSRLVVLHPLAGVLDHLLADVHQTEKLLRPEKSRLA